VLAVVSDRKFGQQLYGYTANTSGTGTHTYNSLANEYVYVGTGGNFDQTSNTNETSYDVYLPEVLSFSDYYPFLMKMPGRNNNSAGYRYQGQGQEEDNEFTEGFLSFEYRVHDPRIGRFLSVDPLRINFPYYSPYHFASNNPIVAVDLEGLESSYRLNFTEISFDIVDGEISEKDFLQLSKHTRTIHYTGSGNLTPKKGNWVQINVVSESSTPQSNSSNSHYALIKVPTQDVTRLIPVKQMVPNTIKGEPATKGYFKDHKDSKEQKDLHSLDPSGTYRVQLTTDDFKDKVLQDSYVGTVVSIVDDDIKGKITSITLEFNVNSPETIELLKKKIKEKYMIAPVITYVPASEEGMLASNIKVGYIDKVWVPGTEGTPDTTIWVEEEVMKEVTIPSLEIIEE
jgi:RHS repeat-associated protein